MRRKNTDSININRYIGKNEKILICKKAVLGKDKRMCNVVVTGVPFDDNSSFYMDIYAYVMSMSCVDKIKLKGGYNPNLQIVNFNGIENSMYITIDSGGSGGFVFFYIVNFNNCRMNIVLSDDIFNEKYDDYTANYRNNYRVRVSSDGYVYGIDISCKGMEYLRQIYRLDGTLKQPTSGYVSGANYTFATLNSSDTHNLVVYQKVVGLAQVDGLGNIQSEFSFVGDKYYLKNISMITYSSMHSDCIPL